MSGGTRIARDGGYGWVIVLSAFVVNFLLDGILFCFGILLVELTERYGESTASVAALGGLFLGIVALVSPFVGALCDVYGKRYITLVGTVLLSLGLFTSMFAASIQVMYLTYGLISGIGYGLMYTPPFAAVMEHFSDRRALAGGIALCGSGIGVFVMGPVTNHLLETYSLPGTFFILSGIMLNGLACGFALPKTTVHVTHKQQDKKHTVDDTEANSIIAPELHEGHDTKHAVTVDDTEANGIIVPTCTMSILKNQGTKNTIHDTEANDIPAPTTSIHEVQETKTNTDDIDTNNIQSPTIKLQEEQELKQANDDTDAHHKSIDKTSTHVVRCVKSICCNIYHIMFKGNIAVLRNFDCFCILLTSFVFQLASFIPITFLPKEAVSLGMEKSEAAWLTSALGISGTVSRVLIGWIGNRSFISQRVILECIFILVAVSFPVSIALRTFETKIVFASVYGFLYGSFVATAPVLLANSVTVDDVGKTTGLFVTMCCSAVLVGVPLAGWTVDRTGDFTVCYIMATAETLIAAVVLTLPAVRRKVCSPRNDAEMSETTHL